MLEGKISCTVPGAGEYELLPGYVTAFPKYTERTSSYVADTHLLSIHITSAKPLFRDGVRQMRIEAMDSRQRGSLDMIIGSVNGERYRDSELISAVWGLLDCLLVTNELEPSPKYRAAQKIKAMIDNDFRSDTPISEYAKLAAVSESTLRRLFFEYTGLPPARYRIMQRLKYAKLLIVSGEYTVGEAARQAGFDGFPISAANI